MGRRNILKAKTSRQRGWSLVELTVTLALLIIIATYGMKTMISALLAQDWTLAQSMTDAYAAIETATADRYVFADIPTSGHWSLYPNATISQITIGQTPNAAAIATALRTYRTFTDPSTNNISYLLESYVFYGGGTGKINYCKISKVIRSQ
jgi:type II secretory pathway pseudopilin PulG